MTDLEQAIQRWYDRMERQLRGMQEVGADAEMHETLDLLQKHVQALMTLYEPPMPMPESSAPMGPAFRPSHTFGSNY